MKVGVATDVGKVRELNEDSYCIMEGALRLYMVADGMGGYNGGEVASQLAVETMKACLQAYSESEREYQTGDRLKELLLGAFHQANRAILEAAQGDLTYKGMGTTATLALLSDKQAWIGHVGDSRAYLIHQGQIRQITEDHSLVAELVKRGSISEREAMRHPQKNIITRALGTRGHTKADIFSIPFQENDMLILCTDGLSNFVDTLELEKIVLESEEPGQCCLELVELANQRGGYDNITVMIVQNKTDQIESR